MLLSILFLVVAFLLAGVLAATIKRHHPALYIDLRHPLFYEWYPFWVFRLLRRRRFQLLTPVEIACALVCMACMLAGLIFGVAWASATLAAVSDLGAQ